MAKKRAIVLVGDCLNRLPTLPDCSVDSVVTDPPYELGFMGKAWDKSGIAYNVQVWRECLRVLKPGGHLLAFGGSRTYHRLACAVEDAGFDIRDQIMWLYGSGFPKSLDVSKAIDKAAGSNGTRGPMKRGGERLARLKDGKRDGEGRWGNESGRDPFTYVPAIDLAKRWQGWGTALKPAHEPIVVARKPIKGTVAENVTKYGTGAINVDGCRVELNGDYKCGANGRPSQTGLGDNYDPSKANKHSDVGRWPANIIHDGSDEVVEGFPNVKPATSRTDTVSKGMFFGGNAGTVYADSGSAARFFYCAKASKADRGEGNGHPTVKPTTLMRYLCRLVTSPGGIVLDPFTGSGSTGKGAVLEGFRFIGIEREVEYVEIAKARIISAIKERA